MVRVGSSKAGREGDLGGLEGLPEAVDMTRLGVEGDGHLGIVPRSHPQRITWIAKRHDSIVTHWIARYITADQSGQNERRDAWLKIVRVFAKMSAGRGAIDSALNAYSSRIAYLRDEATHDGYELNESSEDDFKKFVRSRPYLRKGDLVLMDNGNLRAIWKDEQGGRLGLQFLGDDMVQYVIFWRRQADRAISRVAGRDSLEGIVQQIDAFQLHSLLCE